MDGFFEVSLGEQGELRLSFESALFRNLVAGLPALWALLADLKPDSESKARGRLYGSPHVEGYEEDFWEELMVPELEGALRSDRELVFRAINDWASLGADLSLSDVGDLAIGRNHLGAWIGVLGQVRLMISEETGISEAELSDSGLTDRRRALALGQWVYGAILESIMPYWD